MRKGPPNSGFDSAWNGVSYESDIGSYGVGAQIRVLWILKDLFKEISRDHPMLIKE